MKTYVLLERIQQGGNVRGLIAPLPVWVDQNMHVLRHDDVPHDTNTELLLAAVSVERRAIARPT